VKASSDAGPPSAPNWACFYSSLLRIGPLALIGIPPEWIDWFRDEGSSSEWFWYEGIQEEFFDKWQESPELAVKEAFQRYVLGVQAGLQDLPVSPHSEGWVTCDQTGVVLTWEASIGSIKGELAQWQLQALLTAALTQTSSPECHSF